MSLRNAVLAGAAAGEIAGLALIFAARGPGLQLAVASGVLLVLVLAERWRYRRRPDGSDAADFEPTGERYRDPATGEMMEVEFDRANGTRRYVKARERLSR